MLLSIVVPSYNSGKFLPACLDSILHSGVSLIDFEVIVINDGSTDDSLLVAQSYVKEYPQVSVYSQSNQGLSGARNSGLAVAKGDYVWFVDADDEIGVDILSAISILKENEGIDILGIVLQEVDEEKHPIKQVCSQPSLPHNKLLTGREAVIMGYNPSSACALIMRTGFLQANDLNFKMGITHEDVEFTYRAVLKAKTAIFSDLVIYYYYRRGDTMSTPYDNARLLKYIIDDVAVALSFEQLANQNRSDVELYLVINKKFKNTIFGLVLSLFRNRKEWGARGINEKVLEELKKNRLYPLGKPFYSWKKALISQFLNKEKLLIS